MSLTGDETSSPSVSGAVSTVTEDLEDETATTFSDGPQGGRILETVTSATGAPGDINDLDFLLNELAQEQVEEETQRQLLQQQEACVGVTQEKCEQWLLKSPSSSSGTIQEASTSKNIEERRQSVENDDVCIEKLSAMLRDAIISRNSSSSYGDDEEDDAWRRVPSMSSPLAQLGRDFSHNLPGAMMSIVSVLTSSVEVRKQDQSSLPYTNGLKNSLMQILHGAAANSVSKHSTASIKTTFDANVVADTFEEYFAPFKVVLKSHTRMNRALSEALESYVNDRLQAAKTENEEQLRWGWIKLSNSAVTALLRQTNETKFLNLSTERLAKYASRLQAYVWENIMQRCLKAVKSLTGFNLIELNGNENADSNPSSLMIESQESQASLSSIPESVILAAVNDHAEGQGSYEVSDGGSDSQRSDGSIEFLRGSSDYESQPDSLNLSQDSLPRRSPDIPLEAVAAPAPESNTNRLDGFLNETYFSFGGGGSQSSSDGSDSASAQGPSRKFRRLN